MNPETVNRETEAITRELLESWEGLELFARNARDVRHVAGRIRRCVREEYGGFGPESWGLGTLVELALSRVQWTTVAVCVLRVLAREQGQGQGTG